jgi:hypothetical protein
MAFQDKLTEFNMSLATLQRIDKLIKQANLCSQGLFAAFCGLPIDDNKLYIKALDGIYLEAQCKMTPTEIEECRNYRIKIGEAFKKWNKDINRPTIEESGIQKGNQNYYRAWREIKRIAREYNIYLMQVMDKHNMLLKNKDLAADGIY